MHYPPAGRDIPDWNDSVEAFDQEIENIWEYNYEPVVITLQASHNAKRSKHGPFTIIPEDYEGEYKEDRQPEPQSVSGFSGLGDVQLRKAGYIPKSELDFKLEQFRAEIEFDRKMNALENEKREHRRKMEQEREAIEAERKKIESWGNRAQTVAGYVVANKEIVGNLTGGLLKGVANALGVKSDQLEALGAVISGGETAVNKDTANDWQEVRETPEIEELDEITDEIASVIVESSLDEQAKRVLLRKVKAFIFNWEKEKHENINNPTGQPNGGTEPEDEVGDVTYIEN